MAEGDVDLRFIGQKLQCVQSDLRDTRAGLHVVRADRNRLRAEVRSGIAELKAHLDAFRESVAGRFEQVIELIKDTCRSLEAKIDRLLPPK